MDEKRKATAIIHTVITPSADAAAQKHRAPSSVSRTRKELEPIALRVAENAAVMQQVRAAMGSENRELAREATQAIWKHAQELDPSITFDEGTTVVIILAKMLGHFKEPVGALNG